MKVNLPNQITLARLAITGVFFLLLSQYDQSRPKPILLDVCLGLYVLAGVSDFVDGHLARRRNEITSFGKMADPFADKILTCGAFIFFAGSQFVERTQEGRLVHVTGVLPWMVVLILARELFITALRGADPGRGGGFGASGWGKVKMVCQTVTAWYVLIYVAHLAESGGIWRVILLTSIYVTVAVTVLSAVPYLGRARGVLSEPADAASDR